MYGVVWYDFDVTDDFVYFILIMTKIPSTVHFLTATHFSALHCTFTPSFRAFLLIPISLVSFSFLCFFYAKPILISPSFSFVRFTSTISSPKPRG